MACTYLQDLHLPHPLLHLLCIQGAHFKNPSNKLCPLNFMSKTKQPIASWGLSPKPLLHSINFLGCPAVVAICKQTLLIIKWHNL